MVFTLKEPSAIFLATVPEILVVNSKLVKKNEKDGDWGQAWLAKNVASTGSYKLKRYDPAIGFVGERFKEHFAGWGPKAFDEIEFRTVLETNTRVQGLIKGDFQGTDGYLPYDQILRLKQVEERADPRAGIDARLLLQHPQRPAAARRRALPPGAGLCLRL